MVIISSVPIFRIFTVLLVLPFLNNPKDLDLSYKMDINFWDCFGRKTLSLISKEIQ